MSSRISRRASSRPRRKIVVREAYQWGSIPPGLQRLQETLLVAERQIALLQRCTPLNFAEQCARMASALQGGQLPRPQFQYVPLASELERTQSHLASAELALPRMLSDPSFGILAELLMARVQELAAELALLRVRGSHGFVERARAFFRIDEAEYQAADERAIEWSRPPEPPAEKESTVLLVEALGAIEAEKQLGVRIVERDIPTICAVGGDMLFVRSGARAPRAEVKRLWAHEVEAHLLPRLRARRGPPPFSLGTAGAGVDEEGRALLLEERIGSTGRRRFELAVRHRLARAVQEDRQEAEALAVRLVKEGLPAQLVAHSLGRSLRGGGLAREAVYLPAYLRVRRALEREPALERWMEQGLVAVAAARKLQAYSKSITTGA